MNSTTVSYAPQQSSFVNSYIPSNSGIPLTHTPDLINNQQYVNALANFIPTLQTLPPQYQQQTLVDDVSQEPIGTF
jgi:hypothetical protein